MSAIVLKHNWIRQPYAISRINWKHPLTVNLRAFCVPFGNTFIDLVSGKLFTRQAHAVEYPYVEGQRFLGADTVGAGFHLDGISLTDTVTQSVACFARLYNTSRNDTRKRAIRFFNAAANSTVVNIDYSGGTGSYGISGGVQIAGPIWPVVTLENDHIPGIRNVGFSRRANGGSDFIGLPANLGSTFWTTADFAYTIDAMTIGGSAVDSFPFVGGAAFVGFYSEYTTFEKLDAITKNPWQILLPNRRLLWNGIGVSVNDLLVDEIGIAVSVDTTLVLGQAHTLAPTEPVVLAVLAQPYAVNNTQLTFPQHDLPIGSMFDRISGASSIWDDDAGLILEPEYFDPAIHVVRDIAAVGVQVAPALGTPLLSLVIDSDDLEADGFSLAATLETPLLSVRSDLSAQEAVSACELVEPVLSQNHNLDSGVGASFGVTVSPTADSPALGLAVSLVADEVPDVTAATGNPVVSQGHAVSAQGASSQVACGFPAVAQVHGLTASVAVSQDVCATPSLGQAHSLDASLVVVSTSLVSPAVSQQHQLAPTLVVSAPVLGTPNISIDAGIDNLATPDIASSTVFLASPGLSQLHGLSPVGINASVQLEHPLLAQNHALSESALIVNGNLASPVLRTIHSLTASSIDVTAFLGHPGSAVLENLASPDTVVSGSLTANPGLAQIHNLVPFNISIVPVNESPVILQQHSLIALGLVSIAFLDSPKVLAWEFLPKTHVEIASYGDTQFEYAAVGSFEIQKNADGILQIIKSAEGITSLSEAVFGLLVEQMTSAGVLQLRLTSIGKFSQTDIGG